MDVRAIRSIHGVHLATHKTIGKPYLPLENSTLNQKFDVYPNEVPQPGQYPYVRYVAIGCKGARFGVTTDNRPIINQVPHSAKHASLYDQVPWVVRRLEDDLPLEQRRRFRMRKVFMKDSITYVAYYLMAMSILTVVPTVELRHVENGESSAVTFEPDIDDLMSPEQIDISNIDYNDPEGDCLISTAKMRLNLDENDIAEIINGFTILDGDPSKAIISEIAICSGIDREVQGAFGNTQGTYTEAVCAQVNVFVHQVEILTETKTAIELVFDIGSSELMIL